MGDRPLPVPADSKNLAFVSQFVELAEDVVFTVEYSVRAAQVAGYQLLRLEVPVPPILHHDKSVKVQLDALIKRLLRLPINVSDVATRRHARARLWSGRLACPVRSRHRRLVILLRFPARNKMLASGLPQAWVNWWCSHRTGVLAPSPFLLCCAVQTSAVVPDTLARSRLHCTLLAAVLQAQFVP